MKPIATVRGWYEVPYRAFSSAIAALLSAARGSRGPFWFSGGAKGLHGRPCLLTQSLKNCFIVAGLVASCGSSTCCCLSRSSLFGIFFRGRRAPCLSLCAWLQPAGEPSARSSRPMGPARRSRLFPTPSQRLLRRLHKPNAFKKRSTTRIARFHLRFKPATRTTSLRWLPLTDTTKNNPYPGASLR